MRRVLPDEVYRHWDNTGNEIPLAGDGRPMWDHIPHDTQWYLTTLSAEMVQNLWVVCSGNLIDAFGSFNVNKMWTIEPHPETIEPSKREAVTKEWNIIHKYHHKLKMNLTPPPLIAVQNEGGPVIVIGEISE